MNASEFLELCLVFGVQVGGGGGGGGNFQPNNGYEAFTLAATNLVLTNPDTPTAIRVFGQPNGSRTVKFPNMGDVGAWPAGSLISFNNDGDYAVTLLDFLDQVIFTVPARTIITFTVTDNSTPGGYRFNIAGAETFAQALTNLQITGAQDLQLIFRPTATDGAVLSQTSSFSSGIDLEVFNFPPDATAYVIAQVSMPKRWDGGNFNLFIPWYSAVSDSGNVVWLADAVTVISGADWNTISFGPPSSVTTSLPGGGVNIPVNTVISEVNPINLSDTDNPPLLFIRIYRQGGVGPDDFSGSAELLQNVAIIYTVTQGNDN